MSQDPYFTELERTKKEFFHMGELAQNALADALLGLTASDAAAASRARALEAEIDALNRTLNAGCLRLMTLWTPVAGDARLVTGMLGAIVDLELIGDYADDIAVLVQDMPKRPTSGVLLEFATLGQKVQDMLAQAADRWRAVEKAGELSLRPAQTVIKRSCNDLMSKVAQLRPTPGNVVNVALILTCKYLERIASHSVSLAEQAAFVSSAI